MEIAAISLGKCIGFISKLLNLGAGGTWPGEIALRITPNILRYFARQGKTIILITGTNGKTTTGKMLEEILHHAGYAVRRNKSGANLDNGIASTFIHDADLSGRLRSTHFIIEVDEATIPLILRNITPNIIVILNLFRDQLDRYGEVDVIAEKWRKTLATVQKNTTVILNSDDPHVASLGDIIRARVRYFGLDEPRLFVNTLDHATDSAFCVQCGSRLDYGDGVYYSHIGLWMCHTCGRKRPKPDLSQWPSPLPGLYNRYNTIAAVLTAQEIGVGQSTIRKALTLFSPAFGRQEEFIYREKKMKIFLSKNPAGFNMSLRTVLETKPHVILLALNDRIPDGRDVSWIWDVDFEMIPADVHVIVSGDRVYDLALRIKYSQKSQNSFRQSLGQANFNSRTCTMEPDLKSAIRKGTEALRDGDTLYILPTYSAMLDIRKILVGRKIL